MKKIVLAAAMATLISGAAFAQSNPNAPQPGSTGVGVNQPGTTATGTAVDRPDSMKKDGMTSGMSTGAKKDGMVKEKSHTSK
jgi:uncharacterized protein YdeI (BOF family)